MNLLCTICARSGSVGFPNKNIKELNGKPLLAHSINQAIETNLFQAIVVSSDSEEILDTARKFGADAGFKRPKKLATASAPKIPVIRHVLGLSEKKYNIKFDVIIDLDVTSPLRSVKDIKRSFNFFIKEDYDNLITGCSSRRNPYFNMVEVKEKTVFLSKIIKNKPSTRQSAPKVFDMNASIYIWKRNVLIKSDDLFTNNTGFYEMPEERSHDIDSFLDWQIVEMIMKKNLNKDDAP